MTELSLTESIIQSAIFAGVSREDAELSLINIHVKNNRQILIRSASGKSWVVSLDGTRLRLAGCSSHLMTDNCLYKISGGRMVSESGTGISLSIFELFSQYRDGSCEADHMIVTNSNISCKRLYVGKKAKEVTS